MKNTKTILRTTALVASFSLLVSCFHSVEKKEFNTDLSKQDVMQRLDNQYYKAYGLHADLLASDSFEEGSEIYKELQAEVNETDNNEEFYEDAAYANAYFSKAVAKAESKKDLVKPILEARINAVKAGAQDYDETREALAEVDDDVIAFSDNFSKTLNPETFAGLQKDYLSVESDAVKRTQLNLVYNILDKADEKDAEDLAPTTYNSTMQSLKTAENAIARNVRNMDAYSDEVLRAKKSAVLLQDVVAVITSKESDVAEDVALDIVRKDRKLMDYNSRISQMDAELEQANTVTSALSMEVAMNQNTISTLKTKEAKEKQVKEVIASFSEKEANVVTKGNDVVIQVTAFNFPFNSSELPSGADGVISKVSKSAEKLKADKVLVQGHADSTGDQAYNEKLSEKRAESVAKILRNKTDISVDTEAVGERSPIIGNDIKDKRAMNRRVDIILKDVMAL
ncbi:MAG: OmpA family protein [Bdellovibrionota bacterium]|nr:OmpA family protein [Bdellovibrionota bacterium]